MIKNLIMLSIALFIFTNDSYANFIDVSTSHILVNIEDTEEDIIISGTIDEPMEIIVKILGPLKTYKVRRYEEILGVWSLTKPQIVDAQTTFYRIFSTKDILSLLGIEQLRKNGLDPNHFISEQSHSPDGTRITNILMKNMLINSTISQVEFLGEHFYRIVLKIPKSAIDGHYTAAVYGIDKSGAVITTATTNFSVMHENENGVIRKFKKLHPLLYVATCIFIALAIGLIAGITKNAAKQQ